MNGKGEGVGATLKREREAKGITLDELSRSTKIRRVLLESLEGERWGELPGTVFTSGYIKAIAGHLHLDGEALVKVWMRQSGHAEPTPPTLPEPSVKEERGSFLPWAGLFLLGLALMGTLYWLSQRSPEAPAPAPMPLAPPPLQPAPVFSAPAVVVPPAEEEPATPMEETQAPPPAATLPEPAATPPPEASVVAPAKIAPAVAPAKGDLVIHVGAPCWMELHGAGKRLVYREVQAGETLSFDGEAFTLTAGDASAVALYWKGKKIATPDLPGKVLKGMQIGGSNP